LRSRSLSSTSGCCPWLHPAVPDRCRSAAGVAQVGHQQPSRPVPVPSPSGSLRQSSPRSVSGLVSGLFALCAFVAGTIAQELWRGANVAPQATGTDVFTALWAHGRNKRRTAATSSTSASCSSFSASRGTGSATSSCCSSRE
jgi:hypothetical protein